MSCCNHNCNQGRTCPERKEYKLPTAGMFTVGALLIAYILVVTWQ